MDESLQCAQVVGFVGTDQTDRVTHGIGPPGAADPMDVVFGSWRKIEVHHVRDAVHIDAPGCDAGRHENAQGPAFQLGPGPKLSLKNNLRRRTTSAVDNWAILGTSKTKNT